MQLPTDYELLRAYAHHGSEAAFAQLVERHLPLVWSAARRQMADAQLAEDVAQQVFALLAQKGPGLSSTDILPGWLYRTTSFVTSRALRGEQRRRVREQSAHAHMNEASSPSPWHEIEPLIDLAMTELNEPDRDAVVLRFFQNKSLHEVGVALGTNEGAAQKRLSRAVEKLRAFFVRHGKSVSTGTLTTALATGAVQPAPATLATSISVLALSGATTTGTSVISLMSSAALKSTLAATAGLAVAVAVFIQQQRVTELRAVNDALQARLQKAEAASADQARRFQEANPQRDAEARQIQSELLRLRGEVSQLRQRLKEEQAARKTTTPSPIQAADSNESTNDWVKTYKTEFRIWRLMGNHWI
jgi:RNA polymerase sigma factor (sigma-70 family)